MLYQISHKKTYNYSQPVYLLPHLLRLRPRCDRELQLHSFSLFNLNQRIYQDCKYIIRETGEPFPPGITWRDRQGSCRDYVVLFMEVCRTMGVAARFVSGYQEGDTQQQSRDLHAWVEVYLPGAGWRGYDPTLGLVVCDRHIPLAASAISSYTAAVQGTVAPIKQGEKVTSNLEAQIAIRAV